MEHCPSHGSDKNCCSLFNQIGACRAVLAVPGGSGTLSSLITVGLFDLLLEMKFLETLGVNKAGKKLFPTSALVLRSKA